jgi:hypothetical protein
MTTVKIISGYVEMPVIRSRGGRAATRASNIKAAASNRLEDLVSGEMVGRGVENTDTLKVGSLTPEIRINILRSRIEGYDTRLNRMETEIMVASQEGATSLKLQGMDDAIRVLRTRREKAVVALVSIMRGLIEGDDE